MLSVVCAAADSGLMQARQPMFSGTFAPDAPLGTATASLFVGERAGSMLAPVPRRERSPRSSRPSAVSQRSDVSQLFDIIAKAEAGAAGYDAVQHGARIKPHRVPTKLTIRQINQWITATPGQPHAIGRYQFIPATLRMLVARLGIDENEVFSPQVQDRLAYALLQDAGIEAFRAGQMGRTQFMNNLAKIWAGLPNSSGRSHYDGYAGNKATTSWARFRADMARIFPS